MLGPIQDAAHPNRFGLLKPVDPTDPAIADTIADWAATKGTVGIRVFLRDNVSTDPADPAINRVLAMAAQHSLAVNLACTGRLDQAGGLASRNPNTRLVIDHLGLPQPHVPPAPAQPFADLPKLLALAAHANIAVKISGACTLSHEPFPYKDLWDPLGRISMRLASTAVCGAPTGLERSGYVDLRAGRRGVSCHRPPVGQRAGRSDE